jgi:hypothetical protein
MAQMPRKPVANDTRIVLFIAGPHPELESDFTLFCEVVLSVLE